MTLRVTILAKMKMDLELQIDGRFNLPLKSLTNETNRKVNSSNVMLNIQKYILLILSLNVSQKVNRPNVGFNP